MKKALILLIMCVTLLTGCGGKPSDVSQEMYDTAVYVIGATDMYLDGKATYDETYDKIESMTIPDATESEDTSVDISILNIKTALLGSKESIGTATISDVRDARDDLAKKINYKD